MADRVQDERRWRLIGDEIRPAKLTGPGYGPPQRMTAVDGPALGILERVEVVPVSSLDQALAERDRLAEVAGELADALRKQIRLHGKIFDVTDPHGDCVCATCKRDKEPLAHYESLRDG